MSSSSTISERVVAPVSGRLGLRATVRSGVLVISLTGELDLCTQTQLADALDRLTHRATGPVVVDLADLGFCDLRGLAGLMSGFGLAKRRGVALAIAGLSPTQTRMWQIAFTARVPAFQQPVRYPDVQDAVADLAPSPGSPETL